MSEEIKDQSSNSDIEHGSLTPTCQNGQLYTVKSGDTMFLIARINNVSLQRLIDANPQIIDPNVIAPGQVLCIPAPGPGISCPGGQIYRVVKGDTMFQIASRYGISLEALVKANPQIKDPSEIFPGQEVCIPSVTVACPGGTLYTIKSGDTMFEIARAHKISLASLIAANPQISDPDRIAVGQVICIPPHSVQMPITLPGTMVPAPTPARPCPPYGPMPLSPMPMYIVVPWDECPYRAKNKRDRRKPCH